MTLPDGGALGEREVFVLPVVDDITLNKDATGEVDPIKTKFAAEYKKRNPGEGR